MNKALRAILPKIKRKPDAPNDRGVSYGLKFSLYILGEVALVGVLAFLLHPLGRVAKPGLLLRLAYLTIVPAGECWDERIFEPCSGITDVLRFTAEPNRYRHAARARDPVVSN